MEYIHKFQKKYFVEQSINKVKKFKFLQEFKLLLMQSETYCALAQRVKHNEFWLPVVLFSNFNIYV